MELKEIEFLSGIRDSFERAKQQTCPWYFLVLYYLQLLLAAYPNKQKKLLLAPVFCYLLV